MVSTNKFNPSQSYYIEYIIISNVLILHTTMSITIGDNCWCKSALPDLVRVPRMPERHRPMTCPCRQDAWQRRCNYMSPLLCRYGRQTSSQRRLQVDGSQWLKMMTVLMLWANDAFFVCKSQHLHDRLLRLRTMEMYVVQNFRCLVVRWRHVPEYSSRK